MINDQLDWILDYETTEILRVEENIQSFTEGFQQGSLFEGDFKTVPPGFTRGFEFSTSAKPVSGTSDLIEIPKNKTEETSTELVKDIDGIVEEIDGIKLDGSFTFIRPSRMKSTKQISWAKSVDANHIPIDFDHVVPKLAFEYPFELDPFQKQAVYHLEKNESVFVAAHTSAGKTVVAEYAIALAQKHLTKAIYTSPIKALSNQKFRDFKNTFDDVGLLTGDVQLNPDAPCLIMTTEILRSMLYRGADLVADVEFVIFDEVHYVNDAERGVVWEEVIIMLPPHVTLIMLSATIPNTLEFADWVGRTKQKDVYVISTLKRPVPLEHFLYVKKEPVKIVDPGRNFIEAGYKDALIQSKPDPKHNTQGGLFRGSKQDRNLWIEITYMLKKRSYLPAVIFTFSKRKCEDNAEGMASMDFNTPGEKSAIHLFLENSLQRLKGTDSQLPQIVRMKEMLSRGIAVHHSGLLPIMKEAVEIMFSKGLIKVLFATETFAMGVNMPARTVVFSSIRKHDGNGFRNLLPGEYTQMAGRAGRRGLDSTGIVIIACPDEVPAESSLRNMMLGLPTKLTSQFRLTYHMILNLLRVQALRMEEMIKKSFSENSAQKNMPLDKQEIDEHEDKLKKLEKLDCVICERDLSEYYATSLTIVNSSIIIYDWLLNESKQAARYFEPGRIVIINSPFHRNTPAVILRLNTDKNPNDKSVSVLVLSNNLGKEAEDLPYPPDYVSLPTGSDQKYEVFNITSPEIIKITRERLKLDFNVPVGGPFHPRDLQNLQNQFLEFLSDKSFTEFDLPNSKSLDIEEKKLERKALLQQLRTYQCVKCPDRLEHYQIQHKHQELTEKLAELQFKMSDASMQLLPEDQARIRVLKRLEYVDAQSSVVLLKGRVAAEINTTDELITTELLFSNVFADFEPAEIIALLSCMVFQEKHASPPKLEGHLLQGQERILEMAKNLVTLQRELGVDIAMDQVVGSLRFGLVEVVYEWACGKPFKQITELTDVLEGSIVRCIVRLDETCRELRSAAKIMGDPMLHRKMEEASNMIKRDICFASSLYY